MSGSKGNTKWICSGCRGLGEREVRDQLRGRDQLCVEGEARVEQGSSLLVGGIAASRIIT